MVIRLINVLQQLAELNTKKIESTLLTRSNNLNDPSNSFSVLPLNTPPIEVISQPLNLRDSQILQQPPSQHFDGWISKHNVNEKKPIVITVAQLPQSSKIQQTTSGIDTVVDNLPKHVQSHLQSSQADGSVGSCYTLTDGRFISAEVSTDNEFLASVSTADEDSAQKSNGTITNNQGPILSELTLKVVKMEEHLKSIDRRLGKLESNIDLIINALGIHGSSKNIQKIALSKNEPPGALVFRFPQIKTIEELNWFENKLVSPVFYKESVIYHYITHICVQS